MLTYVGPACIRKGTGGHKLHRCLHVSGRLESIQCACFHCAGLCCVAAMELCSLLPVKFQETRCPITLVSRIAARR